MKFNETFIYPMMVQFEDVDAGGVVHHPNYIKFYERARSACLNETNYSYLKMMEDQFVCVVAEMYMSYRKPLKIFEKIYVLSKSVSVIKGNLKVVHAITSKIPSESLLKDPLLSFEKIPDLIHYGELRLVCVDLNLMKPTNIPHQLKEALNIPEVLDKELMSETIRIRK